MDDVWVSWFMMACIGAASGWFAANILHGRGLGLLGNIMLGILGAYIGHWLFDFLRIPPFVNWSYMGDFIYGVVGSAVILLLFGRLLIPQDTF